MKLQNQDICRTNQKENPLAKKDRQYLWKARDWNLDMANNYMIRYRKDSFHDFVEDFKNNLYTIDMRRKQ